MKHPLSRSFATIVALLASVALSACGSSGDCSGPLCGGGSTGPTSNPPGAPGIVTLTVDGTTIIVTWTAGSGATSHRVNLTTPQEEARSQTVGGTATSASFTGLTRTRTYTGQVIAVNSDGETAGGSAQALVPAITGAIRARARIDGSLTEGVLIELLDVASDSTQSDHTDSTGIHIFRDLEPGEYEVYPPPTLDYYSIGNASHTVDVEAGVLSDVVFSGTAALTNLALGTPVTGLAGFARSSKWFVLSVTVAAVDPTTGTLVVTLSGGTGDAELFVVDPSENVTFSVNDDSNENVSVGSATGEWHVLVLGFTDFAGVTLNAVLR